MQKRTDCKNLPFGIPLSVADTDNQPHKTGFAINASPVHQGSPVFIYAPGSQYVDKQYIASPPSPLQKARGVDGSEMSKSLPDELTTDEAMALWRKAQQAGYVNEHYQPTGSRPEAAILAYEMARILGIEDKWKSFETLWNRRNMYRDYHTAINQKKSLKFRDKVRDALT